METRKKFDCKHEELVVICDYVQTSFQRDLADFTAFSPKFNAVYLADFKKKNEEMNKIIFPAEKTKELKTITARLYANMDKLIAPLDRLEGYVKLAQGTDSQSIPDEDGEDLQFVPLSPADFGVTVLKQKIRSRDAEGTLKNLQQVNSNIEKYRQPLTAQGLTPVIINQLKTAFPEIDTDNQKQYQIVSNRRILTAENINLLNTLYNQMMEICEIGKTLYKKTQKSKLPDYTFAYLKKKVRIS